MVSIVNLWSQAQLTFTNAAVPKIIGGEIGKILGVSNFLKIRHQNLQKKSSKNVKTIVKKVIKHPN